jgi:hypothetical protein
MKMRKIVKSKKGDISAPIITVLLIIASIAIATLVISWMYGLGSTMSKQGTLVVVGTPVIQPAGEGQYTLYITLKNGGNTDVTILGLSLSNIVSVPISEITIEAGQTKSLQILFSYSGPLPNVVQGLIQTDAGNIPFQAVVQQ